MNLLASHRCGTLSLDERRDDKALLERTLLDAIDFIDWFFSKYQRKVEVEGIMNFMEAEGVFSNIPERVSNPAKNLIRERLTNYLDQRAKVETYRRKYKTDLVGLLKHILEKPIPHPGRRPLTAIWEPDCVTVVLPNHLYDQLNGEEQSSHRSVGWALPDKALNVARRNTKHELAATHIHERRHQINPHLMPEMVTHLDQAQDEILAFMEEDYGERETLETLTEPHGIYDYYEELKKNTKDEADKKSAQKMWRVHCRRVAKGIQVASLIGKSRMDELSIKPLAQWRKLLSRPPKDDFFFPGAKNHGPTRHRIKNIFRENKNRDLISQAGLGNPDEIEALLPRDSGWYYTHAESGILSFICIGGEAMGTELVLIPSLKAIHEAQD